MHLEKESVSNGIIQHTITGKINDKTSQTNINVYIMVQVNEMTLKILTVQDGTNTHFVFSSFAPKITTIIRYRGTYIKNK